MELDAKALLVQTSNVYVAVEQVMARRRRRRRTGGTAELTGSRMVSSVEGFEARPKGNFLPVDDEIVRRVVLLPREPKL